MNVHRVTKPLLRLIVLGVGLAMFAPAQAQNRRDDQAPRTSATLRIHFGTEPHWVPIRGTRVEEIPMTERPGYDMFRFDGRYYVYSENHWYSSTRGDGDFDRIDDRSVPTDFSNIPREHWRTYPMDMPGMQGSQGMQGSRGMQGSQGGPDRSYRSRDNNSATLQFDFGTQPRWGMVRGTNVRVIRNPDRPDYDVFRYNGYSYVYRDGDWYMSRGGRRGFMMIDERDVPRELRRIPRREWHHYPADWSDRDRRYR